MCNPTAACGVCDFNPNRNPNIPLLAVGPDAVADPRGVPEEQGWEGQGLAGESERGSGLRAGYRKVRLDFCKV